MHFRDAHLQALAPRHHRLRGHAACARQGRAGLPVAHAAHEQHDLHRATVAPGDEVPLERCYLPWPGCQRQTEKPLPRLMRKQRASVCGAVHCGHRCPVGWTWCSTQAMRWSASSRSLIGKSMVWIVPALHYLYS